MTFRSLFSVLLLSLLSVSSVFGVSKKQLQSLPPTYREWLTRDVVYLITDTERDAFLQLSTDDERDKFIERFWDVRNPNPGSPSNPYKDEIYRRIAYANQWYGENNLEGWRTDRGHVYITLGKPKQVDKELGIANVRPLEIWFYDNDNPALPPFFYVMFYRRENSGDFRLYSPFMDGPEKLVTGAGTENNRVGSWKELDKAAGREISRTSLSLIPSEPVDYETATSSLASDMLLNNIRNLANHPLNVEMLKQKRELLESVSHRVILGTEYLDALTVPLVDKAGETNLHYVLRLRRADDFSLAEDKDKNRYYYSATVNARVLTPEGKLIFAQDRKLSKYVDAKEFATVKTRVFGYEGLLPLPPGKYKLEFQVTDEIKKVTFRAERDAVVPQRPTEGLRITDAVPFTEATSGQPDYLPFTAAGVRFTPAMDHLVLLPGRDLQLFYQLWAAPTQPNSAPGGNLQVEYAYGRMGLRDTQTLKDEVSRDQFDSNGTLISGKKIPTATLAPGDYRMAITVTDPATRTRAAASFQFRIADSQGSIPAWDVVDPDALEDVQKGTRDFQRALCYVFDKDEQQAAVYLQKAYSKNHDEATRDKLVDSYYSRQAFDRVAELYKQGGITPQTSEQTILQIAESLNRLGQTAKAIQVLEAALPNRQSSALYMGLARYYQASGDSQKAAQAEQKAKTLAPAQPSI